jgi:hypothetical protein
VSWLRRRFFSDRKIEPTRVEDCPFSREVVADRADQTCDICRRGPGEHRTRAEWREATRRLTEEG